MAKEIKIKPFDDLGSPGKRDESETETKMEDIALANHIVCGPNLTRVGMTKENMGGPFGRRMEDLFSHSWSPAEKNDI